MESPQFNYEEETKEQMELFDQYNDKIIALRTFPLMQQIDEWQTSHFIERLEAMIRNDLKGEEEHGQLHLMNRIHQFLSTTTTQHILMNLPFDRIEEEDIGRYGEINKVLDMIQEVENDARLSPWQKYKLRERLEHIWESKPFKEYIQRLRDTSRDYFVEQQKPNAVVEKVKLWFRWVFEKLRTKLR